MKKSDSHRSKSNALRRIFEEKSVFEEGVYRAYTTDEEERFIPKIPAKTRRLQSRRA